MNRPLERGGESVTLLEWKEIDRLCDRFEAAREQGAHADVAAFVEEVAEPVRRRLFGELLASDLEFRARAGDRKDAGLYLADFPGYASVITAVLAASERDGRDRPAGGETLCSIGDRGDAGTIHDSHPGAGGLAEMSGRAAADLRAAGYEVLCELGRGGMGIVYLARHLALKRLCALKMILSGLGADGEWPQRFLAEAEALARLEHPNIVRIHHVGLADGRPFLDLEYLPGGSLEQTGTAPKSARQAAQILEVLARAIHAAHGAGIVHRDLKPANILLAADGTPKIVDFGLAKDMAADSAVTRTLCLIGSPSFVSPEQALGRARSVGPAADIYALGAVLYVLLTGRPPHRAPTVLETLELVKAADPAPPSRLQPSVPVDLETICMKCLEKEPSRRYKSALDLASDLKRFLGGEPILARPVSLWHRAQKWARRQPAAAAALSVAVISVFCLVSVFFYYNARLGTALEAARAAEARAQACASGRYVVVLPDRSLAWANRRCSSPGEMAMLGRLDTDQTERP